MNRQETLDKELKKKGLLRKSDGAPKDALELDFKIESFIRRYLDMLPGAVQAGGQHQRNELIITSVRECPACGESLSTGANIGQAAEKGLPQFEGTYEIVMQAYTLTLDTPITGLPTDTVLWMEVVNSTTEPEGNTCVWHWAQHLPVGRDG
ncbi:MAG: hypothetical protein IH957_12905, partial [Chloroflexi bacterium]|nr:hypothetical protein [Chloroflexota bacterium]